MKRYNSYRTVGSLVAYAPCWQDLCHIVHDHALGSGTALQQDDIRTKEEVSWAICGVPDVDRDGWHLGSKMLLRWLGWLVTAGRNFDSLRLQQQPIGKKARIT
jgi:hypothetical protein